VEVEPLCGRRSPQAKSRAQPRELSKPRDESHHHAASGSSLDGRVDRRPHLRKACASRLYRRLRQVSGHGFIRAVTSLFTPCHPDRPRASFASKREWKDPENEPHHHAASGSSLRNIFHGEPCNYKQRSPFASTMNQRQRRDIIEPTLKASDRVPTRAVFCVLG
jgi:hypothetical protein